MKKITTQVEISARHVHLTQKNLEKLFGKNHKLVVMRELSQPGEFATTETLTIKSKKEEIKGVRLLGPTRDYSQVELSKTDAHFLGLDPQERESGDINGTPGITLIGPKGTVRLKEGAILAYRHLHASTEQAKKYNLKHGQLIKAEICGGKACIFEKVMVKVSDHYDWRLHLDTDEGNAAGVDRAVNNTATIII